MNNAKYRSFMTKIIRYARKNGIRIFFNEDAPGGCFIPDLDSGELLVFIDPELPREERVNTILHELGHAIDFMSDPKSYLNLTFANAKVKVNKRFHLTRNEKAMILKTERVAWKNARTLASKLGILVNDAFTKLERQSLATYVRIRVK